MKEEWEKDSSVTNDKRMQRVSVSLELFSNASATTTSATRLWTKEFSRSPSLDCPGTSEGCTVVELIIVSLQTLLPRSGPLLYRARKLYLYEVERILQASWGRGGKKEQSASIWLHDFHVSFCHSVVVEWDSFSLFWYKIKSGSRRGMPGLWRRKTIHSLFNNLHLRQKVNHDHCYSVSFGLASKEDNSQHDDTGEQILNRLVHFS